MEAMEKTTAGGSKESTEQGAGGAGQVAQSGSKTTKKRENVQGTFWGVGRGLVRVS